MVFAPLRVPGLENYAGYTDPTQDHPGYSHTSPAAPDLTPAPKTGGRYSDAVERWRPLVEKYFKPEDVDKAMYVINGESGGDPGIKNSAGSGATGLFQIMPSHGINGADPETAVKWAASQVADHGWTDWGEGVTYQGKPFGVLGLTPYPGTSGTAGPSGGLLGAIGTQSALAPGAPSLSSGAHAHPVDLTSLAPGTPAATTVDAAPPVAAAPAAPNIAPIAPVIAPTAPGQQQSTTSGPSDVLGTQIGAAPAPAMPTTPAPVDADPQSWPDPFGVGPVYDGPTGKRPPQNARELAIVNGQIPTGSNLLINKLAQPLEHYGPSFALGTALSGGNPAGGAATVAAQIASEAGSKALPAGAPDLVKRAVSIGPYFATPGGDFNVAKRGVELAASLGAGELAKSAAPSLGVNPQLAQTVGEFAGPVLPGIAESIAGRGEAAVSHIAGDEGSNGAGQSSDLANLGHGIAGAISANFVDRILSDLQQGVSMRSQGTAEQFADYAFQRGYTSRDEVQRALLTGQRIADAGGTTQDLGAALIEDFPQKPPAEPAPGEQPPGAPPDAGGVSPRPPSSVAPDATTAAGDTLQRLFGVKVPDAGLSPVDKVVNIWKQTITGGTQNDAQATPIMRERAKALQVIDSQANRTGSIVSRLVKDNFDLDEQARIKTLAGKPTIQDLAANLPEYEAQLSPAQQSAMEQLRAEAEKYHQAFVEQGLEVGSRPDVKPGGFYLPRGRADLEGEDAPLTSSRSSSRGGRGGFEKVAVFDSMAQGIDAGYQYASLSDAMQSYARKAGQRALDAFTANTFKGLTDDAGNTLATTAADRINPQLRDKVQTLRAQVATRLETLTRQQARGGAQDDAQSRLESLLRDAEQQVSKTLDTIDAKSETYGHTDIAVVRAEAELRVLERQANQVGASVNAASDTALNTADKVQDTQGEIASLRGQLDDLKDDWARAKRIAAQSPRGQGSIDLPGLQGYSFPDAVAGAANKELAAENSNRNPPGYLGVIRAANNLMRGLGASADLSGLGIQGLLGLTNDPVAYGKAVVVSLRALGDKDAVGAFVQDFDKRAADAGKPTSEQWIAAGLRHGGSDTEFSIGNAGLKGAISDVQRGRGILPTVTEGIQHAPIIEQSNRSFGALGDVLRLEMADSMYQPGRDIEELANASNLLTGWSRGRFLGNAGEFVQFAPRFFQSQLETLTNAFNPASGTAGVESRKALIKLVGLGSLVTFGANAALGNPVGGSFNYWSPDVDGHANPNFMRVRAAGQDISVFGQWGSLFNAFNSAAHGDMAYLARSRLNAPVLSRAWDIISGKDFQGNDVGGAQIGDLPKTGSAEYWLRSIAPFSISNIGQQPLATTGISALGVKANPETPAEQRNAARDAAAAALGQQGTRDATGNPLTSYADALPTDKQTIDADPKVSGLAGNVAKSDYQKASDVAHAPSIADVARNEDLFDQGKNDRKLSDVYHDQATANRQAALDLENQFATTIAGFSRTKYDQAVDGYYSDANTVNDPTTGSIDFDATAAARQDYLSKLPADQQAWLNSSLQATEQNKTPRHQEYDKYIADKKAAGYFALDPSDPQYSQKKAALDVANPALDVAAWRFNSVVKPGATQATGGDLNSTAAVDQALALNLPNREVKLAGLTRPVNENAASRAIWAESKDQIDYFFNKLVPTYGDAEAQHEYKKPYAQLTDEQKNAVNITLRTSLRKQVPQLDAWLVWWGAESTLQSNAALQALNQITQKWDFTPPDPSKPFALKLATNAR